VSQSGSLDSKLFGFFRWRFAVAAVAVLGAAGVRDRDHVRES
jgi:hypothetical protein